MRIGFEAKRILSNKTGLGNYSRTLIHNLTTSNQELQLYLYCSENPTSTDEAMFTHPTNISFVTPTPQASKIKRNYWRHFQIGRMLSRDQIDVFHGLSHMLPNGIKCPKVVTIHDLIFLRYPQFYNFIDRMVYRNTFKKAIQSADAIIAISEATKKDILTFFDVPPQKIKVTYQTASPLFYNQTPPRTTTVGPPTKNLAFLKQWDLPQHYILFVGTLEPRKNILSLIQAYAQAKDKIQQKLVFSGKSGRFARTIHKEIGRLNLTEDVKILGFVPDQQLPELYNNADLFIYPSLFEGFGIPVLEAMLCGCPVVTSNSSSMREVGGNAAIYVNPLSIDDISNCLLVLNNSTELAKRREMSLVQAQLFSPDIITKNVLNIYRQLI